LRVRMVMRQGPEYTKVRGLRAGRGGL